MTLLRIQGDIVVAYQVQAITLDNEHNSDGEIELSVWLLNSIDTLSFSYQSREEGERAMLECVAILRAMP